MTDTKSLSISHSQLIKRAEVELSNRKLRAHFLPQMLSSEIAWDTLVHLFIHRLQDTTVNVRSLIDSITYPDSTTRRWLGIMIASQLVNCDHPSALVDEAAIQISELGFEAVRSYLELKL